MAIERGEVEKLLGWAELDEIAIQPYGHVARMADSSVIAELCRSYLAVLDAPVVDLMHYSRPPMRAVTGVYAEGEEVKWLGGQRVRLVPADGGE